MEAHDLWEEKEIHEQSRPKLLYRGVPFSWVLEISIRTKREIFPPLTGSLICNLSLLLMSPLNRSLPFLPPLL